MTYEKIIVFKDKGMGKLSLIHRVDHSVGVEEMEEYLKGTIVELHPAMREELAVTVFTEENKVKLIHTKCILFTAIDGLDTDQIVSAYEVIWAAGIKLCDKTLKPVVDEAGETSMKGVFYIQTAQLSKTAGQQE